MLFITGLLRRQSFYVGRPTLLASASLSIRGWLNNLRAFARGRRSILGRLVVRHTWRQRWFGSLAIFVGARYR
jgi:hypothetical protein